MKKKDKKIYYFIFVLLIIFSLFLFNKFTKNLKNNETDILLGTGTLISSGNINLSLSGELLSENYANIIIEKFNKVENIDDFKIYIANNKGKESLYTFLKIGDKKLFLKYMNFYLKNNNIIRENAEVELNNIFDSFINRGYYNSTYIYDGEYDYFLLSLIDKDYGYKISLCEEGFINDKDSLNSCKKYVTFISSTIENNYCEKLNINDIRWCKDTLKLIK